MQDRSKFVTRLSWLFIVLSIAGLLFAIFQYVVFQLIVSGMLPDMAMKGPQLAIDAFSKSMMRFVMVFIGIFSMFLVASTGLLKRKSWGRILFIGLLSLLIIWQLSGLVFQYFIAEPVNPELIERGIVAPTPDFLIIGVAAAVIGISAWLIKRLMSKKIADEFK